MRDLNHIYTSEPSLHEIDFDWKGFDWVESDDWAHSVLSFRRRGKDAKEEVLAVFNFTPVPRSGYRVGVPSPGYYREILNSDSEYYRGSNSGNSGGVQSEEISSHGHSWSIALNLPPLGFVALKRSS